MENKTKLIAIALLVLAVLFLLAYAPPFKEMTSGLWKAPDFSPPPSEVPLLPNQPEITGDTSLETIGEELDAMEVPAEDEFLDVNQLPAE